MRLNNLPRRAPLTLLALLTMLSACSHAQPEAPAVPAKPLPQVVLPDPEPIHVETVEFGQATVGGKKVYTLDERNFELFGANMGEIARWIEEAKFRLRCYANGGACSPEKPAENAK